MKLEVLQLCPENDSQVTKTGARRADMGCYRRFQLTRSYVLVRLRARMTLARSPRRFGNQIWMTFFAAVTALEAESTTSSTTLRPRFTYFSA